MLLDVLADCPGSESGAKALGLAMCEQFGVELSDQLEDHVESFIYDTLCVGRLTRGLFDDPFGFEHADAIMDIADHGNVHPTEPKMTDHRV